MEEEAVSAVTAQLGSGETYTVNVNFPDQTLSFSINQAYSAEDIAAAAEVAYAYGRETDVPFLRFRAYLKAAETKKNISISPSAEIDVAAIHSVIDTAIAALPSEDTDSQITIVENSIMITVGSAGKTIDRDALTSLVYDAFLNHDTTELTFDYTESITDDISLEDLYAGMIFEAQNAYIDPETDTVVADVTGSQPEIPLETAQEMLASASPGDTLVFPFTLVEADITADEPEATPIPSQEVTVSIGDSTETSYPDTLSSYASPYDDSNESRSENLRLACRALDGTVIAPGETFSFNEAVGERTSAKGYQEAAVYVSGNTVSQLGGGICQVASTLYYCAMYADLDIVERSPHMFLVTYVPGGLDAAIYWGSQDLKFRNNTNHPIQIRAEASDGECSVELLGTDETHYTIEIESVCIASSEYDTIYMDGSGTNITGYSGCTYQITRYVYDSDGNLVRTDTPDSLGSLGYSTYNKRDAVVYRGN